MLLLLFAQFCCALPFLLKIKMYKISRIARVFTSKRIINQGLLLFLAAFQRATAFQGIVQSTARTIIIDIGASAASMPVTTSAKAIFTDTKNVSTIKGSIKASFFI